MKKILLIIFVFFSVKSFAQYDSNKVLQPIGLYGSEVNNSSVKGMMKIPKDTFKLAVKDSGAIAYKNNNLYKYNGYVWSLASGSGGGTDSSIVAGNGLTKNVASNVINLKVDTTTLKNVYWAGYGNTITAGQYLGTNNNQDLIFKRNGVISGGIGIEKNHFGYGSLTSSTATNILALGTDAGQFSTGENNTFIGNFSGEYVTSNYTTGIGNSAMASNSNDYTISITDGSASTTGYTGMFGIGIAGKSNWLDFNRSAGGRYYRFQNKTYTLADSANVAQLIDSVSWTKSGTNIYNKNTGNVGIGTTTPTANLHVLQATPASVATTSVTATASPTTIIGGNGGATSSSGGTVNAGNAGHIILTGGNGGAITGSPTTGVGGAGGNITPTAGDGGTGTTQGGNGGNFEAQGGNSGFGTAIGVAGYSAIKGGNAFPSGNGNGGNVFLTAGSKNGSGQDGTIFLGLSPSLVSRGNTVIGSSTDDYTNKLQVTGTVRFQGLPTGVGTKALRIDGSGNLSVADTTSGGGSPSLTTNQLGFGVAGVLGSDAGFTRIAAGQLQNEASVNAMISLKRTGTDYSHWRIYNGINGAGLGFNAADYGLFRFVLQPDGEFRLGGNALATPATLNGLTNGKVGIGVEPVNILDVAGSFGNAITTTSANLTLTDAHHTVIITSGTPTITLPAAGATNTRREYVLVNQTVGLITISSYLDFAGASATTIPITGAITIQSDGTNWYRVN